MKLPTTQKTSGFHICDILELNEDKKKSAPSKTTDSSQNLAKDAIKLTNEPSSNQNKQIKQENSSENVEKANKRKFAPSPPLSETSDQPTLQESKKAKQEEDKASQMFANTFQHYPHLFQNAVRPWLFNGHNGEFEYFIKLSLN